MNKFCILKCFLFYNFVQLYFQLVNCKLTKEIHIKWQYNVIENKQQQNKPILTLFLGKVPTLRWRRSKKKTLKTY